jgi:mannose-6-phosphate isomerase-like protein (cupin superfamily)
MRALVIAVTLLAFSSPVWAQQPAAPPKLFVPAADLAAMIAKAKRERKPDQANFTQPIVGAAPYSANLEYRVAGVNANATIHETDAEMFVVVEGSGTMVTGGKLKEERRTNAANLAGTGIDGGKSQRVSKGDIIMVPPKTAHWFGEIDGALVLMSIHLPMPAASTR